MKKIYEKFLSLFKTQVVEDKPYYLSYENGGVLVLQNPVEQGGENITSNISSSVTQTGGA
jgi:hypothetical protein